MCFPGRERHYRLSAVPPAQALAERRVQARRPSTVRDGCLRACQKVSVRAPRCSAPTVKHWLRYVMELGRSCGATWIIFSSQTPRRDSLVNEIRIRIQAAEIPLAFGSVFTQHGDGARLHDLKKIKAGGRTDFRLGTGADTFHSRLRGRDPGGCVH